MAKASVLKELLTATKIEAQGDDENPQVFLERLHKAVDKLPEAKWDTLSDPAQDWYNKSSASVDAKKGYVMLAGVNEVEDDDEEEDAPKKKGSAKKAAAKPAKGKTKKSKAGRRSTLSDDTTIKVLAKEAPNGKKRASLWKVYKKSKTVADALKGGATRGNIRHDADLGNIRLGA